MTPMPMPIAGSRDTCVAALANRNIGMPNPIASRQAVRYTRRLPTRSVSQPAKTVTPTAGRLAATSAVSAAGRSPAWPVPS
ncbi:hypothetical protein UA75_17635 [Actinoalloteichus sp. GBA129-24]|nr:hypothetical protein UA75_17635 [Actinoalloteichus sp. GBA129-24]